MAAGVKVSVCVGSIRSDTVPRLVRSIRQQTFSEWELIVVGQGAAELIHVAMACLAYEGSIDFFIQSVFIYPSLSEAFRYAAYDGLRALAKRRAKSPSLPSATPRTIARE